MNERVLAWLCCPECRTPGLELYAFSKQDLTATCREITEGVLRCRCGQDYPVIGGVPRLLPATLRDALVPRYPEFFRTHEGRLRAPVSGGAGHAAAHRDGQIRTMESFGFEWNEFRDYDTPNFDRWTSPLTAEAFAGKLVLDAGCGAGRHALQARGHGAEVVAMDLSAAVDAAYGRARATTGVHVVQGDIFNPPFVAGTFDLVYSLGVLHHTPDPPEAFRALVPLIRPHGTVAVMVYAGGRPVALTLLRWLRGITTRLPLRVTKGVAWLAAVIDTAGPISAYRALRTLGLPQRLLDRLVAEHVRLYAGETFRTRYTDWLDRLSYPYVHYYFATDLHRWFQESGVRALAVQALGRYGWVGVGQRTDEYARATRLAGASTRIGAVPVPTET